MPVIVKLNEALSARGMTLGDLAEMVPTVAEHKLRRLANCGIDAANLRMSSMAKLCDALECQPNELFEWRPED